MRWVVKLVFGFGVAFCGLVAALAAFGQPAYASSLALVQRGAPTAATITGIQTMNHGLLDYELIVDGATYRGTYPSATFGSPTASSLEVGQQVNAIYDRDNPGNSCLCDPTSEFRSVIALWLVVCAVAAGILSGIASVLMTRLFAPPRVGKGIPEARS